ncbi:PadR family transcriptional regulator [candidate division KSB1 bacterium]
MIPLSRREEQVLLAIWNLKDNAYLLSIKKHLSKLTGSNWPLSAVQKPLLQLERKGFIKTHMGEASPVRGGRRKKICRISPIGIDALKALRKEQEVLWQEFLNIEINSINKK